MHHGEGLQIHGKELLRDVPWHGTIRNGNVARSHYYGQMEQGITAAATILEGFNYMAGCQGGKSLND